MPQRFDPNTPHQLGAGAIWLRPTLAPYIAVTTATWAITEVLMANVLAATVKGDPEAVIALYGAFNGARAQRSALSEVVAVADISDELRAEMIATFNAMKGPGSERNEIVHGLWGISDAYPDALVHCTTASWIKLQARTHDERNYSDATLDGLNKKMDKVHVDHLDMHFYKHHDFKQTLKRLDGINVRLSALHRKLRPERYLLEEIMRPPSQP